MKVIFGIGILLMSFAVKAEYYPPLDYRVFGQPAAQSDKVAIDNLMHQFWKAWSAQDAKAVAEAHSADAEWTNAFGRTFRGSRELEDFLKNNLFPDFDKDVSKEEAASFMAISRRYIGAGAAVVTGRVESNRGSSVGSSNRKIGFTFVLSKNPGEWKISNQIITDLRERHGTK